MSEITHITCARCGGDNVVRNDIINNGILQFVPMPQEESKTPLIALMLNCQHCEAEYPIVKFITQNL